METRFAAPERDTHEQVRKTFATLKAHVAYDVILDLIPDISLIVNSQRQVLFANAFALSSLGLETSDIIGSRPGEIIGCIHAGEMPGGCGTSEACSVCGAVNAILEAFRTGIKCSRETRITTEREGRRSSLDLLVTAMPFSSDEGRFVIMTLNDISDSKRRHVLERIFFHDLMNSLASLQAGMALLLGDYEPDAAENEYLTHLSSTTEHLIDEVSQQREFLTMEKGDLEVNTSEFDLVKLAIDIISQIGINGYAKNKRIALKHFMAQSSLRSDPVLIRRVITNMLKNALEASSQGEEASLILSEEEGRIVMSVHNPAFIPREVQLQIFQRSFSTKGRGRGIGTYSMKMLTENYLEGEIGFSSDELSGTTFRVLLPRDRG